MWRFRFIIYLKHAPLMWPFRFIIYLKHASAFGDFGSSYILIEHAPSSYILNMPPHCQFRFCAFDKPAPNFSWATVRGTAKERAWGLGGRRNASLHLQPHCVYQGFFLLAGCDFEASLRGLDKLGRALTKQSKTRRGSELKVWEGLSMVS